MLAPRRALGGRRATSKRCSSASTRESRRCHRAARPSSSEGAAMSAARSIARSRSCRSRSALAALGAATLASARSHEPRRALSRSIAAYGFAVATALAAMVLAHGAPRRPARAGGSCCAASFVAIAGTTPLFVRPLRSARSRPRRCLPVGASHRGLARARSKRRSSISARGINPRSSSSRSASTSRRGRSSPCSSAGRTREASAPSPALVRRERTISAVGLPILAFTLTFAAFDWLMSLQPGWVSNMFGVYVFSSGLVVGALACSRSARG